MLQQENQYYVCEQVNRRLHDGMWREGLVRDGKEEYFSSNKSSSLLVNLISTPWLDPYIVYTLE